MRSRDVLVEAIARRLVATKVVRPGQLRSRLMGLRSRIAHAAQRVYDDWDPEWHSGGICDDVADAMSSVVALSIADVEMDIGGWHGDHAFLQVWTDDEAFVVDIPPSVYETGGGYRWEKIEDVRIRPGHVVIDKIPRSYIN